MMINEANQEEESGDECVRISGRRSPIPREVDWEEGYKNCLE